MRRSRSRTPSSAPLRDKRPELPSLIAGPVNNSTRSTPRQAVPARGRSNARALQRAHVPPLVESRGRGLLHAVLGFRFRKRSPDPRAVLDGRADSPASGDHLGLVVRIAGRRVIIAADVEVSTLCSVIAADCVITSCSRGGGRDAGSASPPTWIETATGSTGHPGLRVRSSCDRRHRAVPGGGVHSTRPTRPRANRSPSTPRTPQALTAATVIAATCSPQRPRRRSGSPLIVAAS